MNDKSKKYFIGLDLGTNSVGYAVMDKDCRVMRKSGKKMWGSVLFDEGQAAASTRVQRSSRRRFERRKERIRLLQSLTAKSVAEVDPSFFARLERSFLLNVKNDDEFGRDNIFNLFDGSYTDRDYYAEYKTIYHLRKRLCEDKSKADIRLVYLALHHMIKYRGNFLHDEERLQAGSENIAEAIEEFFEDYKKAYFDVDEETGEVVALPEVPVAEIAEILKRKGKKSEKKDEIIKKICGNAGSLKKKASAFASLLLGYKADLSDLFSLESGDDDSKKETKVSFESADYDEKAEAFPELFGDEGAELICRLKAIYSDLTLSSIIGEGKKYVYEGMIERYEKNKKDLLMLKTVLKADEQIYREFFKDSNEKKVNFVSYFKPHVRGKLNEIGKRASKDDFYKEVQKLLNSGKFPDSEAKNYVISRIEEDDFLIKLNSTRNAVIPYQLNLNELELILDNQSVYYPELAKNRDKIISLLTFRRPYSVGVIKPESRFAWVENADVKDERAYPWNFDEVVDYDSASEKFIKNLTGRCTYFKDQLVLPANSVIYQAYNVLNELANVSIVLSEGGQRKLTVSEKQQCFTLFLEQATVKPKDITSELFKTFNVASKGLTGLGGDDGKKFLSKMTGYRAIKTALKADCFVEENGKIQTNYELFEVYEKIAEILTVFNDGKIKRRALEKLLGEKFPKAAIDLLVKQNFVGWGRLSKKCLCGVENEDGQNVLETMYSTSKNFMEVISGDTLGFKEAFEQKTDKKSDEIKYSEVNELYISPSVKRTVWQAVKVVKEVVKAVGCEPCGIYVESTRQDDKKKTPKKRIEKLKELYENVRKDTDEYNRNFYRKSVDDELKTMSDDKLNDDMVYLYMLQMGKSMYSGKPLDLRNLSTTCEIDHIVPRHYIKDDGIENRVLVLKQENQEKSGTLALKKSVRDEMTPFWAFLKSKGFIAKKKFLNLTKSEYTESDMMGFINRQLVETNQSMKAVRDLLKSRYSSSDVEFVKAGISSAFRSAHTEAGYVEFFKLRELNDFHHAKDAYLAAAIGYFTRKIYPIWGANSQARQLRDEIESSAGRDIVELCQKRNGIVVDAMIYANPDRDDNVIWNTCYNNILSAFSNNDCLVTRKKEEASAQFYNATVWSKRAENGDVNLRYAVTRSGEKKPLPLLYGNYNGENDAYFVLATVQKGKKTETVLTGVPVRIAYLAKKNETAVDDYLKTYFEKKGKVYVSHDKRKILKYQLIRYNGQLCYITAATEVINAEQLIMDKKYSLLLYCIAHPNKKVTVKGNVYRLTDVCREQFFTILMKEFIFDYVEKVRSRYPLYKNYADMIEKFVTSGEFDKLSFLCGEKEIASKVNCIAGLLTLTSAKSKRVNMKGMGGENALWGRLSSRTIRKNEVDWIDTSITGIYRTEVKGDE